MCFVLYCVCVPVCVFFTLSWGCLWRVDTCSICKVHGDTPDSTTQLKHPRITAWWYIHYFSTSVIFIYKSFLPFYVYTEHYLFYSVYIINVHTWDKDMWNMWLFFGETDSSYALDVVSFRSVFLFFYIGLVLGHQS